MASECDNRCQYGGESDKETEKQREREGEGVIGIVSDERERWRE